MTNIELLIFGSSCLLLGISLFATNLLVLQDSYGIHRPLALFCGIQAVLQMLSVLITVGSPAVVAVTESVISVVALPLSLMVAPLFWLYVRRLTSEDGEGPIRWKGLHFLPFLLVGGLQAVLWANHDRLQGAENMSDIGRLWYAALGIELIYLSQIGLYVMLSWRRVASYRVRLKDLFASTEDRELRWMAWIAVVTGIYLVVDLVSVLSDLFEVKMIPLSPQLSVWLQLALPIVVIWIISIWGARQKPGLFRPEERVPVQPSPTADEAVTKYERSALTPEQARRIARKIKAVMETDLLYRDPNLSLWGLANRIGVTSNHVSQTLNETLGESFFDHVNKWRVKDAIGQLTRTDQSILTIAYDVGFNSRSPFYKAFKRETGMTPTELRAKLATEAALPPREAVLPEVRKPAASQGEGHAEDRQGLHPHDSGLPA